VIAFISPLFLIGALAAAIPIILHLIKREPEARVPFGAVQLLHRAPIEHVRRRRLRELLLLAMRVAAVTFLAVAFARPFLTAGSALETGGVTVIVLDTSLSMSAPGQAEKAHRLAADAANRAPSGDRIAVVAFDDAARVVQQPTGDRTLVLEAIRTTNPGYGGTRYRAGLGAAAELIGSRQGTIVVVTDLQESGWDSVERVSVPETARIEVADVGAPPPNLAITALRAGSDRIVASIRSTDPGPRETKATLTIDGQPTDEVPVSFAPNQSVDVVLRGGRGSEAVVTIEDRQGLLGDNARYLVLGSADRPSVLVVTTGGDLDREAFFLREALTAGGSTGASYRAEGVSSERLSAWTDERLDQQAAVFLLSTRGMDRRGRELLANYTRRGGGVFIAAGPDVAEEDAANVVGSEAGLSLVPGQGGKEADAARTFAPADLRHPLFQGLGTAAGGLGLVKFQRVSVLKTTGCDLLARFTTGEAAIVDCGPGEGRVLLLTSDLNGRTNDFPRRALFVPFIHESVRYLAGIRSRPLERLVGSGGSPASKPGIVTVRAGASGGSAVRSGGSADARPAKVAVNVDPTEFDPGRISVEAFGQTVAKLKEAARSESRLARQQQEDSQHLWQYLMAAALLFLACESVISTRTA
jgi:hypothetical protein